MIFTSYDLYLCQGFLYVKSTENLALRWGCVKRSKNQRKKRGHNDLCGSETKKQVTSAYAGKGRKS
jgi:hypothetical protein